MRRPTQPEVRRCLVCRILFREPIRCRSPSIILSRFVSKTEVLHWRFDYEFVDCSFPWCDLLTPVVAKPEHCRSCTRDNHFTWEITNPRVIRLLLELVYHHYDFGIASLFFRVGYTQMQGDVPLYMGYYFFSCVLRPQYSYLRPLRKFYIFLILILYNNFLGLASNFLNYFAKLFRRRRQFTMTCLGRSGCLTTL